MAGKMTIGMFLARVATGVTKSWTMEVRVEK
jgi:hypothetical protein